MAKKKAKTGKPARADKALVARRVDDVLRIRLDGAEFWDLREFMRAQEAIPASAWFVEDGATPLSDGQLRRYQQRADRLVALSFERNRSRLLRRHLAQRRHLYARAVASGDLNAALSCLKDEAKMLGLYPPERTKTEFTGRRGNPVEFIIVPGPAKRTKRAVKKDG